jgi:TPR repeat protein
MPCHVRAGVLTVVLIAAAATHLSAQGPHELSVYALVDAGHVPVPSTCSCISSPFSLVHPPSFGPVRGPGGPLGGSAPGINFNHLAEDRRYFGARANDGLSGNGHASIAIAMHLALESALAGLNPQTEEEAARWLHLAATQEHQDAFRQLGFRYAHGRGVKQDDAAASYWFHQGALRGDAISMTALALRYAAGRGVPQDWGAAVRWLSRAQARTPLASRFLGDAYACGLGVAPEPARAAAAYKAAADAGEMTASTQLGHLYAKGCIEADDEAAVKAYRSPADQGDPEAQIALSDLILQGRGADPNPYEAYTLARLAELRLPDGSLKARAAEGVKRAARQMLPEAIPAQEKLVRSLIEAAAKPIR